MFVFDKHVRVRQTCSCSTNTFVFDKHVQLQAPPIRVRLPCLCSTNTLAFDRHVREQTRSTNTFDKHACVRQTRSCLLLCFKSCSLYLFFTIGSPILLFRCCFLLYIFIYLSIYLFIVCFLFYSTVLLYVTFVVRLLCLIR